MPACLPSLTQLTTNMEVVGERSDEISNIENAHDEAPQRLSSKDDRNTAALDEKLRQELLALFRELRSYAISIGEYYKESGRDVDLSRRRMHSAAFRLYEHIDRGIQPGVEYLISVAYLYDLDESTRANGYRSFIIVVERCCQRLLALTRYITCHRDSLLFRLDFNSRELDAYVTTLGQLRACLYYLHKLVAFCGRSGGKPGRLFANENDALTVEDKLVAEQMMGEVEMLCQDTFYGRCLGFQFCHSMVRPLSGINTVLASFSQGYKYDSTILQFASSVFSSGKYMLDPDCRGHQVVEATRNGDISFCKAFWSLNENSLLQMVPTLVCPTIRVNHVFHLNPDSFEMERSDVTETVIITSPCANTGPAPISVRLLSREVRQGQDALMNTSTSNALPPATGLIIHCHGGGFVAQSSASHEVYLRKWASDCDVPILCVDYSLAPEHKYPRQLEEVFFAYCWAIKNCHLLGSTAKRVCIVGDSAGGTLAVATALRTLSYRVRVPDGVLAVYGCFLVKYAPSPSRLLSLMDPLLPLGVLPKCLAAYTGMPSESFENSTFPVLPSCDRDTPAASSVCDNSASHTSQQIFQNSSNFSGETLNDSDDAVLCDESNKLHIYDDSGFVDCPLASATSLSAPTESSVPTASDSVHSSTSETANSTHKATLRDLLRLNLGSPFKYRSPSLESPNAKRSSSTQVFSTPVESPSAIFTTDNGVLKSPTSPWINDGAFSTPTYAKMRHFAQSPVQQPYSRAAVAVARNPYMSPLLASDDLLADMCPVYLVTCHLDPMLDDSISFAQRLRQLGRTVHCDVLDGLPHGFLNFVLMSPEAKAGSDLCIRRLRDILFEYTDSNESR